MYHMAHPPKKRARKIAMAVFRGKRSNYEFDVFPFGAEIRDSPAVFIFSRRSTDKLGKGHHAVVCVGETESILAEQKKHKRAVCVKQNALNSLCILREEDAETRAGVLDDLLAARSFGCVRNVYTAKIAPAPAKTRKPAAASGTSSKGAASAKPVKAADKRPERGVKRVSPPAKKGQSIDPISTKARKSDVTRVKVNPAATVKSAAASATAKKKKSEGSAKPATKPIKANAAKTPKNAKKPKTTVPASRSAATPPRGRSAAAVPQRSAGERTVALSKPKSAAGKRKSAAKVRTPVAAKQSKTPAGRKRIQGSLDSDGGQHRLPKQKRAVGRRTKVRAVTKPRARQKAAA